MPISRKPQGHLINILKATKNHHPNFALFLGSGASVTSGVKTAREIVRDWQKIMYAIYGTGEVFDEWLAKQSWYNASDEYSKLFESLYDQPSQRREFIESVIDGAQPSWGYIYLASLLEQRVFDTVFTTNFDDLLNEACYRYSNNVRPIVCSHDSSIKSIRLTSKRPKIIKLHGDFLFDNIKNTISELESLEDNMKDKFKQFAGEYGLIFVGYSGSDRSIMENLATLMRDENNFPHGIYWCVRKGDNNTNLGDYLDTLTRNTKFCLIEIDDFDSFFARVHQDLEIELPSEFLDPYQGVHERYNSLLDSVNLQIDDPQASPLIKRDIMKIAKRIYEYSQPSENKRDLPLPNRLLAKVKMLEGMNEEAGELMRRDLEVKLTPDGITQAIRLAASAMDTTTAQEIYTKIESNKEIFLDNPDILNNISLEFMHLSQFKEAERVLDIGYNLRPSSKNHNAPYYLLNKAQAILHDGREIPADMIDLIEKILDGGDDMLSFGANTVLGRYSEARGNLGRAVDNGVCDIRLVSNWPMFALLKKGLREPNLEQSFAVGAV